MGVFKYIIIMLSTESNPRGKRECPLTQETLRCRRREKQHTTRGKRQRHSRKGWNKAQATQKLTLTETSKQSLLGRRKMLLSGTPVQRKRNVQESILQLLEEWHLQQKCQLQWYPKPNNPECLLKTQNKVMHTYQKVRKMPEWRMLLTRRRRKRKEKVGKCNSNSHREKVTVPSAVERTTMTLRWRTPKQHHNKNVGDSRSWTLLTKILGTEQTGRTTEPEEMTMNCQSCKSSLWWASTSEASTVRKSNVPLANSSIRRSSMLSALMRPSWLFQYTWTTIGPTKQCCREMEVHGQQHPTKSN